MFNHIMKFVCGLFVVCQLFPNSTTVAQQAAADIIFKNGVVVTADEKFSTHQAIAIHGRRVLAVGSNDEMLKLASGNTRVFDLNGNFLMPGMTDAHCHPYALGTEGMEKNDWFDAGGTENFEQLVERVRKHVETIEPGKWIIGGGWNQEDWPDQKLPVHDALSAVSPENPIFFYRRGGNSAFANAKALEIAGIDRNTPDPEGGKIYRKDNGDPTGFVVNMGNNLIKAHFPDDLKPDSYYRNIYRNAARRANAVGLTGWHDAGTDPHSIRIYKQLVDRNELSVRANVMIQNPRLESVEEMVEYFQRHRVVNYNGNNFLQVRSVKVFFDGALGSRGARLFKPYLDDPMSSTNDGVYEVHPSYLSKIAEAGLLARVQICPHAIGSRANHDLLTAFEMALKKHPRDDHRFRSEHAELIHPQDVKRFVELGVIPSVQPIHCTSDMVFLESRIGAERCKQLASPWRSLIDAGCEPACGSDFMVESHRPLWGIYAAVTRQNQQGEPVDGWHAPQRMTREEAIRGYTIWPAKAAFLEDTLGSLEPGKLADIVILDTNLLKCPAQDIFSAGVLSTIVDGKFVFKCVEFDDAIKLSKHSPNGEVDPDSPEAKNRQFMEAEQYRAFAASTEMVLIPGGMYKGKKIEPFYMDVDLVNVGQYKAAVKMGVSPRPPRTSDISDAWKLGGDRRAQNNVNLYAAQSFLGWVGKRLPTEDEWEWAARGRDKGFAYPWGNEPPQRDSACWMRYYPDQDICLGPDLVGVDRATSRDGVHDMAGCLWEWTSTVDPENSTLMILKGGAWYNDDPEKLKVTSRGRATPYHNEVNSDGFRGVVSVEDYEKIKELQKLVPRKPLDLNVESLQDR